MRNRPAEPVDLDGVRTTLEGMLAQNRDSEAVDLMIELLAKLRDRNTELELDRERLLRRHTGKTPLQLSFLLASLAREGKDPILPAPPVSLPPAEPDGRKRQKGHGRKPLPAHLPRVSVEHKVPEAERPCPICGGERVCIGHEKSETLEFVPASFRVIDDLREKLACPTCEEGVATAPLPDKVIEKGRPGPGLLAQVVVAKFGDHIPLTRQHKIYLRDGVDVPVQTMADWVAAVHECLEPVAARIGERALAAHVLHADDTGIKVLDRDAPGGSKKGHLWCYAGDATWAVFRYAPDWTKEHPHAFLKDRRGWLVADAYKGYDWLFQREGSLTVAVGCWAHARRGFVEIAQTQDARPAPLIGAIAQLYQVESRAAEEGLSPDERLRRRQTESAPVVDGIVAWCAERCATLPPNDPLAKASGYVINQRRALARFLEDGRLPIDNTLVERRLRPIAVGRANYLFCGSDAGAERAATAYTLLGTCALCGVEPRAYLTDVLTKLETRRFPYSRLDELLPPEWAKTAPASALVPPSR